MKKPGYCFLFSLFLLLFIGADAQRSRIDFETYDPVSTLVVPQHVLKKGKVPLY